jgi:CheY-like chemotaxis protein
MNSEGSTTPSSADESTTLAVKCVRALMERHQLPRYRQSAWLADAIGLSYAQAHRKMNGAAPWTLEDLARVAALFGETLADLVADAGQRAATPAQLRIGIVSIDCEIWLKESPDAIKPDALVAMKTPAGWVALLAADAGDSPVFAIEKLQTRSKSASRKSIAVLDDDRDLTDSICAHLQASGCDARAFYRTADLEECLKTQRFDGFVIDWIVGDSNTVKLIAALRSQDATCPVIVLTAQVTAGVVQESEIANAVARHNFVFAEKPVRMAILSATLARAFAAS